MLHLLANLLKLFCSCLMGRKEESKGGCINSRGKAKMVRKIFASIIASLCVALACCSFALANPSEDANKEKALSGAVELVGALQESGLGLEQFGIVEFDFSDAFLGSPIPVYNIMDGVPTFDGMQYWPVYSGESVVAVVISCPSEGGTTFVLSSDSAQMLNSFMQANSRVAIVEEDGESYFCSPDAVEREPKESSSDVLFSSSLLSFDVEFSSNQIKTPIVFDGSDSSEISFKALAASSTTSLSVKTHFQGQYPTCWSSSVAVMAEYLTGAWKDPKDISRAIKGEISGGSDQDVMDAFKLYTYPGTSTQVMSRTLSQPVPYTQILAWINNGMPIYAHCIKYLTGIADHAVTVLGYTTGTASGTTLFIMNSGTGQYEIASKGPEDLYYSFPYNKTSYVWRYSSVILTGWQKPYRNDIWRYYDSDGGVATGWRSIGSGWYRFASNGDLLSDTWFQDGATWYYLGSSGQMVTGWQKIGGSWYYFNATGAMLANQWLSNGGSWYYLDSSGAALTGWQSIEGYWYSFDGSCRMRHGWFLEGGTWYYLRTANNVPGGGPEGSMLANGSWYIGSRTYSFNSSGGCTNP